MGPGMATKAEPGPVKALIANLRSTVGGVQRIIALGFGAVILSSLLQWPLALNVFGPLARGLGFSLGPSVASQVYAAATEQFALLLVLPGLSWLVGWVFEHRPLRLTLGAGLFAEAWVLAVNYLSGGWEGIAAAPVYLLARFLLMGGIAVLAARAYRHAQGRAEAGANRRRAPPPPIPTPAPPESTDSEAASPEEVGAVDEEVVPDDEVVED